jgi:hypothetical protein
VGGAYSLITALASILRPMMTRTRVSSVPTHPHHDRQDGIDSIHVVRCVVCPRVEEITAWENVLACSARVAVFLARPSFEAFIESD